MHKIWFILIFLLGMNICYSQVTPKIGSEKGIKEKFILIKKGLPDIKKNLTVRDATFTDDFNVKFEMGNGIINFEESEDDESLTINFSSSPYFTGSVTDFQNYYNTLVNIVAEVFGPVYTSSIEKTNTSWATSFFEKGKDIFSSKTYIRLTVSWILEDPHISVYIVAKK